MSIYAYFADSLNCSARDIQCLRSKSVDDLISAQMYAEKKVTSLKLMDFFEPWLPWIDGKLVKGQLLELEKWNANANFPIKPFIIGTLTEECYIYIFLTWNKPVSAKLYVELMVASFKQDALKVIGMYKPDTQSPDQRNLTASVATRWVFSCSGRNFLEKVVSSSSSTNNSYYLYAFDYPIDFTGAWDNFTFCEGHTCHGADLPYTFDVPDSNFTINGHLLAMAHVTYWTNFIKSGNPNNNGKFGFAKVQDLLNWPQYDKAKKPYMRFMSPDVVDLDYLRDDCNFFDSIGYYH